MVPEDLRVPRRGRVIRPLGLVFSLPSELDVDVWLESFLGTGVEGSAMDGVSVSGLVEGWWVELLVLS